MDCLMRWNDPHRPPWCAFGLIVLAFAALARWVLWAQENVSGWKDLAARFPAGDRPLVNSQGVANVVLRRPDGISWQLGSEDSRRPKIIEVGFDAGGFWLRSTRASPGPAIFIPWAEVDYCYLLSARLRGDGFEVSVHHQGWVDACKRYTAR